MMGKTNILIGLFALLGLSGVLYFLHYKKEQKQKKEAEEYAEFLPEAISGGSKIIGAILLFVIVIAGGAIVMILLGVGYAGKKVASQSFDKNVEQASKVVDLRNKIRS